MLEAGPLAVDPATRAVTWQGEPVELAPREFDVLLALALKAGRVVTRQQIESALYEWDRSIESNAIEVHVHHLRRKLSPDLIRTVRGVGYMMPADGGTQGGA
jgi:two-component system OmpR family response regulator/two-component system response regulator QseB